jgi:ABC-type multidrug transport system fused ATPase/permease subunit
MLEVADLSRAGLKPATFTLQKGECLAVRGRSGAGKTLLLRAIADLDPNAGRVALNGRDRHSMSGPAWRRQVVYLPAEPGWWADGVGEHFPDWDAALPLLAELGIPADADAWQVSRCSTGERLRLALVRALMVEPVALLLDEPTAALDSESEREVQAALDALQQGRTTIVVAHRLQTIINADRIYVIEDGQAVESGTHAELIAIDGAYRAFFAAQFGLGALPEPA